MIIVRMIILDKFISYTPQLSENENSISYTPQLPDAVMDAYNNKKLAIFLGAGISRLMGCKDWRGLAIDLIEECFELGLVNYIEKEELKSLENKKLISIAYNLMKVKNIDDFKKKFKAALEGEITDNEYLNSAYEILGRISSTALFITTNADTLFDVIGGFREENIKSKKEQFVSIYPDEITVGRLYHIHGIKDDIDDNFDEQLVFTAEQYISRYSNDKFREFLKYIFREYTVLFLGYGLSEFELLDYVIDNTDNSGAKKHFILEGLYSHQKNMRDFLKGYYETLNVNLITYNMNDMGYKQQIQIFEQWIRQIKVDSNFYPLGTEEIEELLMKFSIDNKKRLIDIINSDEYLRKHFFEIMPFTPDVFNWVDAIVFEGYLNPEKNPRQIEDEKHPGFFSTPHWTAMEALKISFLRSDKSTKWKVLVKRVLDEIYSYCDKNREIINYRTELIIVDILFGMSNPVVLLDADIHNIINGIKSPFNHGSIERRLLSYDFTNKLEKNSLMKLLKMIIGYYNNSGNTDSIISIISHDDLFDFAEVIVGKLDTEIANILLDYICEIIFKILSVDEYYFIYIYEVEIDDTSHYYFEYKDFLVRILLKSIFKANNVNVRRLTKKFLNREEAFFHKIALFSIQYRFNDVSNVLWQYTKNPFELSARYELYNLIQVIAKDLNQKELNKMISWIETSSFNKNLYLEQEDLVNIIAHDKLLFLKLLKSNLMFNDSICKKYEKIYKGDLKLPERRVVFRDFETKSSLDYKDMLEMQFDELSSYLIKYSLDINGNISNEYALAKEFKSFVENKFYFIIDNLSEFLSIPCIYTSEILHVIEEKRLLLSEDAILKIIDYFEALINQYIVGKSNTIYFIKQILWCIGKSFIYDEKKFAKSIYQKIFDISKKCLQAELEYEKQKGNSYKIIDEAINDVYGVALETVFDSIRAMTIFFKDGEQKIEIGNLDFVKEIIVSQKKSLIPLSAVLGMNIPLMYHIDKKWTEQHLDSIFMVENVAAFSAVMTGYLHSSTYFELEDIIINNHYYENFVNEYMSNKPPLDASETFGQRIMFLHFSKDNKNVKEIMELSIKTKGGKLLNSMIFSWVKLLEKEKDINQNNFIKTKEFWQNYNNIFDNELNIEYNHQIFRIIKILDVLDKDLIILINNSIEKAKSTVRYDTFLYSGLSKHKKLYPQEMGEFLHKAFEYNIITDYEGDGGTFYDFVNEIMKLGAKKYGNKLCNYFIKNGKMEFRDLYNNYNDEDDYE